MFKMGRYCKAYKLKKLRQFDSWSEKAENARIEKDIRDGKEIETIQSLNNDLVVYLQENYVVTNGVFKDESVIFDQVTSDWKRFCNEKLGFTIPEFIQETTKD